MKALRKIALYVLEIEWISPAANVRCRLRSFPRLYPAQPAIISAMDAQRLRLPAVRVQQIETTIHYARAQEERTK